MPGAIISPGTRPAPAPEKKNAKRETHEGGNSFGVVYVNSLGREAANAEPAIIFPRGSIIVREKLAKADDAQSQVLVVMIKRAPGFNPKANDWEFLKVDGAMKKILERQKKGSCLDCHASQKLRDFVYPTLVH
ncbi:MAG: cytochrome P460 family protein [bacterium]